MSEWQFEGGPGSWSRGYDVALTWRRSQVQFLPSPPIEYILINLIIQLTNDEFDYAKSLVDYEVKDVDIRITVGR